MSTEPTVGYDPTRYEQTLLAKIQQLEKELTVTREMFYNESIQRGGCEYAATLLRREIGLDETETDLREVALLFQSIKTELEAVKADRNRQGMLARAELLPKLTELEKERDELRGTVKLLRTELFHMAGYAMTVRMDRRKVVDDDVMCLQRQEWCEGLLNAAQDSKNTLTATAPKEKI